MPCSTGKKLKDYKLVNKHKDAFESIVSPVIRRDTHQASDQAGCLVKITTNYFSTKEQDHLHIQGLLEQIRALETENQRLEMVLQTKISDLA